MFFVSFNLFHEAFCALFSLIFVQGMARLRDSCFFTYLHGLHESSASTMSRTKQKRCCHQNGVWVP